MKKWLINKLGGYTYEQMLNFADDKCLAELKHLKYVMEENYGSNWLSEIYNLVNDEILNLHTRLSNG